MCALHSRLFNLHFLLASATLVAIVGTVALHSRISAAQPAAGGEVHGSIYTIFGIRDVGKQGGSSPLRVFLPDISVHLVDSRTSAASITVTTDLDGTFVMPSQPQGIYKLCWQATGFISGCSSTPFVLRSRNANLQPVGIVPERGVVFGRVTFKDGHPCRFLAPVFAVNSFTTLHAQQPAGPARTIRANALGYYVFGGLSAPSVKVTAVCEKAETQAVASPHASTGAAAFATNLALPNLTPTAVAYASINGVVVRSAEAGSKVTAIVDTSAPGGHPLSYRWLADPPQSGFTSPNAPTMSWQVPDGGLATVYVLASDGFGGHALSKVALSTTPHRIVFSGSVRSKSGPAIGAAAVTINGVRTTTDAAGAFALVVPGESPRYMITIEKTGYKLFSRALYAPVNGAVFRLFPTQQFSIDPTKTIHIVEKVDSPNAEGRGLEVEFEAGSIAAGRDGRGVLASSSLHVHVGTYGIHSPDDQLPGDYAGFSQDGKQVRLSSFGASFVSIQDAAGNKFNLAPNRKAKIRQPIDPSLLAKAPPQIPFWHYDEEAGVWIQSGQATRVGNVYEATVEHFSAVNMDLDFNDGACTRILVDTSLMPPFQLRMTTNGGPGVPLDHQNQWVSDAVNVVVREPPNTSVTFDVVDGDGNVLPLASQTFTTGASSPTGLLWPPPPPTPGDPNAYSDCIRIAPRR
jgi:hypothetical protein